MKKQVLTALLVVITLSLCKAQTPELWGLASNGGQDTAGAVFKVTSTGTLTAEYSFISFYRNDTDGFYPYGSLVRGTDGLLYGFTAYSYPQNTGTLFSYNTASGKEKVLAFLSPDLGEEPYGSLIQANDGLLYGLTSVEGSEDAGTILSYDISSSTLTNLYDFGSNNDGDDPEGSLIQATDGLFYGLTSSGGPGGGNNSGELFSFDPTTNANTPLYYFADNDTDGGAAYGLLIQAKNGLLYGLTSSGGANNGGTIFSYNITTGKESTLWSFGGTDDGSSPYGSLIQASDNLLYGLTDDGGTNEFGTLFSFDITNGTEQVLHNFDNNGHDGVYPHGSLLQASDGKLYGTTTEGGDSGLGIIFSYTIATSTEATVAIFTGTNGANPYGDLIEVAPTGINQLAANNGQLTVYPNPASNQFTINSSQPITTLELVNVLGQTVYKSNPQYGVKQQTIAVADLANGIYILKVTNGSNLQQQEVVIAR